jgi:membrane associated rhomboid family serine protease
MFIPLHDDNPLRFIKFPVVNYLLILINVVVFFAFQSGLVGQFGEAGTVALAIIPCELFGHSACSLAGDSQIGNVLVPEAITPITYMFLHGSAMHLLGNMVFLWVFGDNVEDAVGHFWYLVFYLLCGVVAGYAHSLVSPSSNIPLVGASGAVAGVIAAYLMLHPNVFVWALALGVLSVHLKAVWVLGAWVVMQFVSLATEQASNVAFVAHIGGLAAGALLILFMRRPEVKLFQ